MLTHGITSRQHSRGRRSVVDGRLPGWRPAISKIFLVVLVGCGSAPTPVDPEQLAAMERQLAAPFQDTRLVVADRLVIRMTANFDVRLTRPVAATAIQEEQRIPQADGGLEVVYRNHSPASPLRFMLDGTDFRVVREARIIVLGGRSDLTLAAELDGAVSVVRGSERTDYATLRIAADGRAPGS